MLRGDALSVSDNQNADIEFRRRALLTLEALQNADVEFRLLPECGVRSLSVIKLPMLMHRYLLHVID